MTDFDSPWKEVLERYFEPFLTLLFPEVHAGIDWSRGYEFLDKELQKVTRRAPTRRRFVDKLVKVWRLNGDEKWLLVHVEVQGDPESDFSERMFIYHYRIYDRYRRQVVSLAVLTDPDPQWRPNHFGYEAWGCELLLRFRILKLLDWHERTAELEANRNPFATVVMAHLKTMVTHSAPERRLEWKMSLMRRLYARGYAREDILELFRFIDWVMTLPEALESSFDEMLHHLEEEFRMPYVSGTERRASERGLQQGLQQGMQQGLQQGMQEGLEQGVRRGTISELHASILEILERWVPAADPGVEERVRAIQDETTLRRLRRLALDGRSWDDFLPELPNG